MSRNSVKPQLVAAVGAAVRANQTAVDQFDELACRRLGINRTDGRCLDIVDQHRRMTAGQLAAASGLSTGAITVLLDRMERAGYVRRVRDTEDRRRVLVELTDEARRRSQEIWGPLAAEGAKSLGALTEDELRLVLRFFERANAFMAAQIGRLQGDGGYSATEGGTIGSPEATVLRPPTV
jgi:DNA-binding MarR family transcriptional regulator